MSDLILTMAVLDGLQFALLAVLAWRLYQPKASEKPSAELSDVARAIVRHQLGTQTTPGRARLRARIEQIRERRARA